MSASGSKDCIFCRIVAGEIPSPRVFEDKDFICIRDIRPQAKTHLLVVPKQHIASLDHAFPASGPAHTELMGRMMEAGTRIAREQGLLPAGFRAIINTGVGGGQTVFHIHLHLLGGETLGEEL